MLNNNISFGKLAQAQNTINTVIEYTPPQNESSNTLKMALTFIAVFLVIVFVTILIMWLIQIKRAKSTPKTPTSGV